MSELMNAQNGNRDFRRQLLATVSVLALLATICGINESEAADQSADHPTVWIELGGQFEQIGTEQEAFAPPFSAIQPEILPIVPGNVQIAPDSFQKPLDYSFGSEGKILFQPKSSDWVFGAGVRYGRSSGAKHIHQQTTPKPFLLQYGAYHRYFTFPASYGKFADAVTQKTESHLVLDFQAGKDVGLGLFGRDSSSVVSAGLRFAQFNTSMHAVLSSGPNPFQYKYLNPKLKFPGLSPHIFLGKIQTARSFHGFGPSFSWDGSAPFVGNSGQAEVTFDWGANAAILFGRQKASIHHQTVEHTKMATHHSQPPHTVYQTTTDHARLHSAVVPNVGGFAGLSLKFPNAKVSLGYRADLFFGAMDGGIDTRRSENQGFYGPFASVSVGLGG